MYQEKSYCVNCGKHLTIEHFHEREDRKGFYAFCNSCMDEQARSVDYPPEKDRGYGVIEPNYDSLEEGYEG